MYSAWLYFEDSFKDVYFPDQDNWASQVTLSQAETGWDFDAIFSFRWLDGRMYLALPSSFRWSDDHDGPERRIPTETLFTIKSVSGRAINIIVREISRDQMCFVKYELPTRSLTIGRGEQADICDVDPVMTGLHGFLSFRGENLVEYTDQSANGTYLNGRKVLHNTVRLQYGDMLTFPTGLKLILLGSRIGLNRSDCVKHVRLQKCPARKAIPQTDMPNSLPSVYVEYHRAPRMMQQSEVTTIEVEPPISKQNQGVQPLWLQIGPSMTMILPMLMGTVLGGRAGMGGSGLIMISTSSCLAVMWALVNRRYRSKQAAQLENQRITLYQKYIQEMETTLREMNDREYQRLVHAYPNVGECAALPEDAARRLWDRMPTHSDFLSVRLGIGDVPLPSDIHFQKQKLSIIDDPLRDEPSRLSRVYSVVADAPVTVSLRNEPVVGILGAAEAVLFAQGLLMQIASLHSYHDVRIAVLTDESSASQWSWTRWLPHVFANEDREMRMVVSKASSVHEVMSHLDEILMMRKNTDEDDNKDDENESPVPLPHYIIFCTDYKLLEAEPIMRRLLTNKLGMTLVMVAPSLEMLPKECRMVFNVASKPGFLHTSDGETRQIDFEYPNRNLLTSFAQKVAPLRVRDAAENAAIPTLVSFLDIYGVRKVEDLDIWRMWTENHTYEGLRSVIGYRAGSQPFVLDISDKYHGPHGLIAGTTGSGKSVMLQTYILSLALNYSPHQAQFILIDYKGGGMANAFRTLPHVAGIIDNLQGPRIIDRALASLNGEIHRREHIFKALNVENINEYTKLYGDNPNEVKLPHLIIIVDEFAELKSEQPDFMRELVSASRVGRSLGVHLILATQKPSNSVSDEIWANSRFHLCLRVQTRSDSMEMLKRPDAAYIKGMGRCFVQIGNDEIFEQVQTSYSGLTYNPNEPRVEEMPHLLSDTGKPVRVPKKLKSTKAVKSGEKEKTQMDAVLERIYEVSGEHGMAHSKPLWLPEMRSQIFFGDIDLFRDASVREGRYANAPEGIGVILGMADDVNNQRYIPYVVNLAQIRNMMIVGLAGTGKTTAVQSMVYSLASQYDPEHLHIYILSLTSQTLGNLAAYPQVGDIAFENDVIEIKRFINMLEAEETRRSDLFAQASTDSYIEYNRSQRLQGLPEEPAIVVFVDRFEQLKSMLANDEAYTNRLHTLIREGSGRGIHFVVTALSKNEVPSKLHPFFGGIALQLKERADYSDVVGKRIPYEMPPIATFPGRCIGLMNEAPFEIQLALGGKPISTPATADFADLNAFNSYAVDVELPASATMTDVERAKQISASAQKQASLWTGKRPPRIPRIPEEPDFERFITEDGFAEAQKSPYDLPIGYDLTKGTLATINTENSYSWLVTGPKKSGRTNFLKLMAKLYAARGADVFIIGDASWVRLAKELNAKLYTTQDEIVAFTQEFVKNYPGQRKPLRDEALKQGKAAARKLALTFKPAVVLIDNVDRFNKDFAGSQYVQAQQFLQNVYAQMSRQADHYNVALFMSLCSSERMYASSEPLKSLIQQGRGIALGGKLADYDPWNIGSSLPMAARSKALPLGHGYVTNNGTHTRLVVPLAEPNEE